MLAVARVAMSAAVASTAPVGRATAMVVALKAEAVVVGVMVEDAEDADAVEAVGTGEEERERV